MKILFKGSEPPILLQFVKKNWLIVVIGISVIFFFLFSNSANFVEDESSSADTLAMTDDIEQQEANDVKEESVVIIIDIKGEVNDPGVYELPVDARTQDVIDLAGGFTNEADVLQVNLAQKVHDEMAIIVPKAGEELSINGENTSKGMKIQINSASKEEIETLPGIGPSKAEAILTYREEIGSFQSEEDLLEIPGIGEKTLENIRDNLQIP